MIHEKLFIMWKAALEVGEQGEIGNIAVDEKINKVLDVENEPSLETDLRKRLGVFNYYCEVEDGFIRIKSFYGYIELIEAVLGIDPAKIKIEDLIETGQSYIPILRLQLLNEAQMAPWWKLWRKNKDFTLFRLPLDETIKAQSWWQFWR